MIFYSSCVVVVCPPPSPCNVIKSSRWVRSVFPSGVRGVDVDWKQVASVPGSHLQKSARRNNWCHLRVRLLTKLIQYSGALVSTAAGPTWARFPADSIPRVFPSCCCTGLPVKYYLIHSSTLEVLPQARLSILVRFCLYIRLTSILPACCRTLSELWLLNVPYLPKSNYYFTCTVFH